MTAQDLPTPAEMVDAFVHPPRLVIVGERHDLDGDRLLVLSHVELWPWRVVVRGVMANRRPATTDPMDGPAMREGFRRHAEWMSGWSLADDAGTDFGQATAGSSGWATDTWADFHVEWHPCAPPEATTLSIVSSDGPQFTVQLMANA